MSQSTRLKQDKIKWKKNANVWKTLNFNVGHPEEDDIWNIRQVIAVYWNIF